MRYWFEELYYWQYGNSTNFNSQLFSLIAKADEDNKERLRVGFNEAVVCFRLWRESESPEEFFKEHLGQEFLAGSVL